MAFGAYDRVVANASAALEATATVVSTCTSGAAALITMNAGASAGSGSADAPVRRMTAGAGESIWSIKCIQTTLAARYGEIPPLQVWRLPELASLKPLLPMVASRQLNWRPRGFTVTRSASQLLSDADTSTQVVFRKNRHAFFTLRKVSWFQAVSGRPRENTP